MAGTSQGKEKRFLYGDRDQEQVPSKHVEWEHDRGRNMGKQSWKYGGVGSKARNSTGIEPLG